MRLGKWAAAAVAAALLAPATGCGESDNAKNQTPNDQPLGAPGRAGKPAAGQQQPAAKPGGPDQQVKGRGAPLPK